MWTSWQRFKKGDEKMSKLDYQKKIGTKVESEHRDVLVWLKRYILKHNKLPANRKVFRRIAETHLKEDRNYYKKLKKMEAKR
jgi:sulfur relay (sulfurtransferase) DsrC/TusE family protein